MDGGELRLMLPRIRKLNGLWWVFERREAVGFVSFRQACSHAKIVRALTLSGRSYP